MPSISRWGSALATCIILGMMLAFGACSSRSQLTSGDSVEEDLGRSRTVLLSLRTGAETYSGIYPAEQREKKIHTVQALLFDDAGQLVEWSAAEAYGAKDGVWMVRSQRPGSYQVLLVANTTLEAGSLRVGMSLDEVNALMIESSAGTHQSDSFVMRQKGKPIRITFYEDGGVDMSYQPILMERLAARFDINLLEDGFVIESVKLKNAAKHSLLYNNNGKGKELQGAVTYDGGDARACLAQIYCYENYSTEGREWTTLEITCKLDTLLLKPIVVPFSEVKRNHLYMVKLTKGKTDIFDPEGAGDKVLVPSVEVLDWNTGVLFALSDLELEEKVPEPNPEIKEPRFNPLSYMALWNVRTNKTWDKAHTIAPETNAGDEDYVMKYETAFKLFEKPQAIEGSFQRYHLPKEAELRSIIPNGGWSYCSVIFAPIRDHNTLHRSEYIQVVQVGSTKVSETGFCKPQVQMKVLGKQQSTTVALRFAGTSPGESYYRSAWLYFYEADKPKKGLHIYCINVADDTTLTSVDDLTEAWWGKHLSSAVYRFLPDTGNGNSPGGGYVFYWGIGDKIDGNDKRRAALYFERRCSFIDYPKYDTNRTTRLFSDTPLE